MPAERPDPSRGVFETLRLAGGRVQAMDAHLDRLESSTRELYGRPLPAGLRERLHALEGRAAPGGGEERVRIDVEPGDRDLEVSVIATPMGPGARAPRELIPVTVPSGLGAHKWRDRSLLDSLGADPVPLLVDEHGDVLEAAWANVWLLHGGRLATPPADGRILPGVTRAMLLERAPSLGLVAHERPIALSELRLGTVVLTSSLRLAVAAGLGSAPDVEAPAVAEIRRALAEL